MRVSFNKPKDIMFHLIGAKIYMDWILPTNYTSKNWIFRNIWVKLQQREPKVININQRILLAAHCCIIHAILLPIYCLVKAPIIVNMLVNVYPIIVNLYIGDRLIKIIPNGES